MPTAAIISTGDELVIGQALDTNSRWLADRLLSLGITTTRHTTLGDDADGLAHELTRLSALVDAIIVTGGLGPTPDDLTRAALAAAMQAPLEEDPVALDQIRAYFAARARPMPELNRVQALRPAGASILPNPHGTAPGLRARLGPRPTDIFCLPGPPREMHPMFESHVVPRLPPSRPIHTRAIHTCGLGESEVASRLGELMARDRSPLIGTTTARAVVTCRLRDEQSARPGLAERALDDAEREIRARLGPYVFGRAGDTLPSVVLDALKSRKQTLATVESCTGGLLGGYFTDVAGSSAAYRGGWVTYTNQMKTGQVGVPAEIIEKHGAVSRQCAEAMARGGLAASGADHCLAITGIAGPDGGSPDKPVGTVWIARASRDDVESRLFRFGGDRENIRDWSVKTAANILRLHLIGAGSVPVLAEVASKP